MGDFYSLMELISDNQLDYDEIKNFVKLIKPTIGATFTLLDNLLFWARDQKKRTSVAPENLRLRSPVNESIRVLENVHIFAKPAADKLTVAVANKGVGMGEEHKQKIFDKELFTTNPGTASETGSGLGLSLSKNFVEQNGGHIWVESEINKGAVFYFTLPLAEKTWFAPCS